MPDAARSIFRAEARRQDPQARAEILLPRLVSPRAFALFWLPVLIGYRFLVFLVTFYTA